MTLEHGPAQLVVHIQELASSLQKEARVVERQRHRQRLGEVLLGPQTHRRVGHRQEQARQEPLVHEHQPRLQPLYFLQELGQVFEAFGALDAADDLVE